MGKWNWREWIYNRHKLSDQQVIELLQKKYGFYAIDIAAGTEKILLIPKKYFKSCIPRETRLFSDTGRVFSIEKIPVKDIDDILPYGFSTKDRKTLIYVFTTLLTKNITIRG